MDYVCFEAEREIGWYNERHVMPKERQKQKTRAVRHASFVDPPILDGYRGIIARLRLLLGRQRGER